MFLYTCKDTVAPCVIKQLYFMYALLISVPIINCVNDQSPTRQDGVVRVVAPLLQAAAPDQAPERLFSAVKVLCSGAAP